MPKRTSSISLALAPPDGSTPAYRWLSTTLRAQILEGRLRPGARLPSTRDLARQYGLARGTIVSAFAELRAEGYVTGTVGSGTHVSRVLPDELLHAGARSAGRTSDGAMPIRRLSAFARRVRAFPTGDATPPRAFRCSVPALDLFPTAQWAQVASRRLRRATLRLLSDGDALGYGPLREALADYLTTARGVRCTADQVAIVAGMQEALDLTARIAVNPGDRVCVERPGYIGAWRACEALGAKITPLTVDAEGARLPDRRVRARLVYLTPAHQFPLGISMTLPRRLAWLEWARRSSALILEDDYDGEFRFAGRPLPALQGLDRYGAVIFAGSFGKVLFPSLRLGFVVLPTDLIDTFAAAKSVSNRHAPLTEQAVLCDFISDGHFGRHVRRMREVYATRRGTLLAAAQQHLSGLLEIIGAEAGLQTAGWLLGGIDGESAARAAATRDIEVIPLSRYGGKLPREGLQVGFAAVEADEIRRGVRVLAAVLEGMAQK